MNKRKVISVILGFLMVMIGLRQFVEFTLSALFVVTFWENQPITPEGWTGRAETLAIYALVSLAAVVIGLILVIRPLRFCWEHCDGCLECQ